jgi:ribonuclease E
MGNKLLIDNSHSEETRIVVARGNKILEFDFESASRKPLKGNIFLAKVTRVEPSLQAAFVEYGGNRHGFLAFAEIHPDYYQIPIADRMALIKEQEEEAAAEAAEDDEEDERAARSRGSRHQRSEPRSEAPSETDGSSHEEEQASGPEHHDHDHSDEHHDHESDVVSDFASDDHGDEDAHDADHEDDANGEDHAEDSESREPIALSATPEPFYAEEPAPEAQDGDHASDTSEEPYAGAEELAPTSTAAEIETVELDPEAQRIESVGAEDALEEVPRRRERRQPRRRYKIQEVIKRRQILLVQVVKEERGNKGAALTTYLSLAGRYCVLMPNTARGGGISRKITDAGDRRRLKELAREVEVPQGMGLIVRTAGAQRSKPEIKRDFDYLIRLWESVRDLTLQSQAPSLVYEEGNLIKRSIRDLYTKDVDEVVVEGEAAYREAKDFMKMLMPSHAKNVKLYKETRPLFARYQIENQLDALYTPTVTLPSGGYIVINQTEALVAIDINSGKATREHSIEETATKTNLEACDEIGRQLRLRDLAGLVVIDFIDMEENRNNRAVERRLKEALKNDRARIQVGRISPFGLLEMSRQRLRPGLTEGTFRTCPHCEGRGMIRSLSSCGLGILRQIEEYLQKRAENINVKVHRDVAFYLLNEKRDSLLQLEATYSITIFLVANHEDIRGNLAVIERAPDREGAPPRRLLPSTPIKMDSAMLENDDDDVVEEEASEDELIEGLVEGSEEQTAAEGDEDASQRDGRRRRRRGRRGGRGRERGEGENTAQSETGDEVEASDDSASDDTDPSTDENSGDVVAAQEGGDENGSEPRRERGGRGRRGGGRFGRDRERGGRDRGRNGPRRDDPVGVSTTEGAPEPISDDFEAPAVPAEADGVEGAETRERGERSPRGRDRNGRGGRGRGGRDRNENRGERPERAERSERPVETFTPPAFKLEIPEVIDNPEPRKWQPPTPTVPPVVTERKAGWWSKKT